MLVNVISGVVVRGILSAASVKQASIDDPSLTQLEQWKTGICVYK